MACATGKTLISLWVAERLEAKTVLVLLPSLALVRQTLHEWLHETNWADLQYRCVCSDPTVLPEEDALVVRQADLDFKVTTEIAAVRRFLQQPSTGVRIVFSTYQSSEVVATAMAGMAAFDLGIFDEAHKTAGLEGLKSAVALKDEKIPIHKRLFLTATPRHYNVAAREKSGDAKIVYSMDVPEVYGVVAHRLPFSAAASAGIITNYRVVISIVTSQEVTAEAIRRGVVLVKGDTVKARQVAHQIALQAAIARYGVRKIFTFHGRVAAAESFVSSGPEGIATHLPEFHCDHISGAMPTGQRERRMREFEKQPRAVMSNARCLTEGVDVPAVDMVAFLSPRRSLVDIVQATGRAMRHSEGKTFGYVFVPLYVEQSRGETTLEAVKRSNYDEIWNVLNRLQEHDDLLAQIIDDLRTQRGATGGFDDTRFRERVEVLGSAMSLEELRRSITAACLDAIGDPWMERYGQLSAYLKQHGNCDIPVRYSANKPLATWVVAQRYERRLGNLSKERIELLDRLGFTWDPYSAEWRGNYLALLAFKELHGHCRVPTNSTEHKGLRAWITAQRSKRGTLDEERVRLLDKLGFDWHSVLATWDERFKELCLFKEKFGHVRVPVTWKENKTLAGWVVRQRVWKRAGKISVDHRQKLEGLGFEWDLLADQAKQWTQNIEKLRAFKEANGHTMISIKQGHDPALSRWLANQRRLRRAGKLSVDQIAVLDGLAVAGDAGEEFRALQWENKFRQLEKLRQSTGWCEPSRGATDREAKALRSWANDQRMLKRRGRLDVARVARLDTLGFRWEPRGNPGGYSPAHDHPTNPPAKSWDEMYSELTDFFRKSGHCDVPDSWVIAPDLPRWVNLQRTLKSTGRLNSDHEKKLSNLGFSWAIFDAQWEQKLVALKAKLSAIRRGQAAALEPLLARWSQTQRQQNLRGTLPPERKARLDAIGFEWSPYAERWDQMLAAFRHFREVNGHCRVPTKWAENPQLARWVGVQRAQKSSGRLRPAREKALDALGFSWAVSRLGGSPKRDGWSAMLSKLAAFHAEHGHARVPQNFIADRKLGWWVATQRRNRRNGSLTPDQIRALDSLGFIWSFAEASTSRSHLTTAPFVERWNTMLEALRKFRAEHGHCRVPTAWSNNRPLANWVSVQRRRMKLKELSPERIMTLNELGFDWIVTREDSVAGAKLIGRTTPASATNRWPEMLAALLEYKKAHGDCRVPQKWKHNKALASWVADQRAAYQSGRLNTEHQFVLENLGFDWDPIATRWETMFEQLVEYKKRFGDTNVHSNDREYFKLGNWVKMQRRDKKIGRPISRVRLVRLEELGFTWRLVEPTAWEKMFSLLTDFKSRHGHCNVPQRFPENIRFGRWVNTQRMKFKNGKLGMEKQRRLEVLGFSWNTKASPQIL